MKMVKNLWEKVCSERNKSARSSQMVAWRQKRVLSMKKYLWKEPYAFQVQKLRQVQPKAKVFVVLNSSLQLQYRHMFDFY